MSNPARRMRRARRFGHRAPTRMTEYQRDRQAERPRGEVKVHAHLHGLDLNAAAELDEAGAFEGVPCGTGCGQAIEWSAAMDGWQHHATKRVRCPGGRGVAVPPDWYTGEPAYDEAFEDLTAAAASESDIPSGDSTPDVTPAPAKSPRVDGNPYDTEFANGIALGLQNMTVYQGTVPADEVHRRRAHNRAAGRARRINRRAS